MKAKLISAFLVLVLIPGVVFARISLEDLQQQIDNLTDRVEALEAGGLPGSNIFSGSYTILNQDDIDRFCAQYEEVTGSLFIRSDTLTNLDGLTCLLRIGGGLFIDDSPNLTDIDGLSNLQTIGKAIDPGLYGQPEISIEINLAPVTSLQAFHNLTSLPGQLYLWNTTQLIDLTGLEGLTAIDGGVVMGGLTSLRNIDGLRNLQSLGMSANYSLLILDVPITSLGPLRGITTVPGDVSIARTDVTSLSGLDGLTSIGGRLMITRNGFLTSLNGLGALTMVERYVSIVDNAVLSTLAPLSGVAVEGLQIEQNTQLASLLGFDPVPLPGRGVTFINIEDNDALTNLDGLGSYTSGVFVSQAVQIIGNGALDSVSTLKGMSGIGGPLIINDNPILPTLGEAEALRDAIGVGNIRGTISISGNGPN